MATRKPDAEVGALGVWAYDTRRLLGLSDVQVAAAAGVTKPTIRKIEGGSTKDPSQRVLLEMYKLFRRVGEEQDVAVERPPGLHAPITASPTLDLTALLTKQNAYLERITTALEKIAGISPDDRREWPPSPGDSTKLHAVRDGEPAPTTPQESRPEEVAR